VRSLLAGNSWPAEILVVGRESDTLTCEALPEIVELCEGRITLRVDWVTEPGHVPPVEKGASVASGEIVAFVDDDVTVTPGWLERLIAPFSDPAVGVVGGRVITPSCKQGRLRGKPGHTSWYGRHWGNVGAMDGERPIDVDSVMEGNWAWRRSLLTAIRFDPLLNLDDASMYGLDLCWGALARRFRVVYHPGALVYHYPAPRESSLERTDRPRRVFAYCRNYTYVMLKHLSWWRRCFFVTWWFLVGERGGWGFAVFIADWLRGAKPPTQELAAALRGKIWGLRQRLRQKRDAGCSESFEKA
jgi:GT2 family glycosyltransferase